MFGRARANDMKLDVSVGGGIKLVVSVDGGMKLDVSVDSSMYPTIGGPDEAAAVSVCDHDLRALPSPELNVDRQPKDIKYALILKYTVLCLPSSLPCSLPPLQRNSSVLAFLRHSRNILIVLSSR